MKIWRLLGLVGLVIAVAGLAAGLGAVTVVTWQVLYGDTSSLQKSTIMAKIKEETTLFYLDEIFIDNCTP